MNIRTTITRLGTAIAAHVDARDAVGIIGLVLLGFGLALAWPPAAFIVPGAILVYVAIVGVKDPAANRE